MSTQAERVWHGTLGREPWQPQNPRINNTWKRDGFTMIWRGPEEHAIKIGRVRWIPYQFEYDKELKDYVWKFERGGTQA